MIVFLTAFQKIVVAGELDVVAQTDEGLAAGKDLVKAVPEGAEGGVGGQRGIHEQGREEEHTDRSPGLAQFSVGIARVRHRDQPPMVGRREVGRQAAVRVFGTRCLPP